MNPSLYLQKESCCNILKLQAGLCALMENFGVLLTLIKVSYHKLIFSKVTATDWYDTQVCKPEVLSALKRQPPWKARERQRQSLTGGTELTAAYNIKALCHSHNVWGNEMNSLSGFLQFAVPKNTVLSAQMEHAWFWRRAWCKLQTSFSAYQWIPENQTFAVKWQVWELSKNELIPAALSACMYCQSSGQAARKCSTPQRHGHRSAEGQQAGEALHPAANTSSVFFPWGQQSGKRTTVTRSKDASESPERKRGGSFWEWFYESKPHLSILGATHG